jgi:hypothetical protein
MSKVTEAFDDLVQTLEAIPWITVHTEKGMAGVREWTLELFRGPSRTEFHFGCRKIMSGYTLTLTTTGTTDPGVLADRLAEIDATITADRKRGTTALTTILSEEGWLPDEDEGRESFSISTEVEIHINEVNS